ncbi:IS4 family transposase [Massilia sp. Mn16-1_5]|uniref:IS4 family transposase n=1 Tax=Massilia sp. Mn16-1_5 TaxID=2079199 RepID=UPI00109E6858|nr:IS4 family transposase [Massilia sp. Mn16-1_5]THC38071.1 DDE transposase [Massilia sp. Mn16-1_5]
MNPFFIMALQLNLDYAAELAPHEFERFASLIDPEWIDEALRQTGTVSLRRRRLPAEHMVWLVIGLALFRNEAIWHIVQQLDLANGPVLHPPVPSAAVAARERLGEAPMAWLFKRLAGSWGSRPVPDNGLFHGLRSYAVDGVVWSLPDTPANLEHFGGPSNDHGGGAWPQLRAVCLMDTYTHLIRAASFGDYRTGELSFAASLMQAVPDASLTIFDRAYFSAAFLLDWQKAGDQKHWLMRAKTPLRHEVVHEFAPGDYLVRMPVSPRAQKLHPELPSHWQARLIKCKVGGQTREFLTSLCDAQRFPARDIAAHYVQRWEIELGFREIKQGMLKKATTLRSKLPELVRQEVWGLLIAYNLLRHEIAQMASELRVPPQRLSFQWLALAITTALYHWPLQTPGTFPKRLAMLHEQARVYLLPERRARSYPRVVKQPRSKFPMKNASQLN